MPLKLKTLNFNFQKIFDSGLFYFFYEKEPVREIYVGGKLLKLEFKQEENRLIISCSRELEKEQKNNLIKGIKHCFGLEEDLTDFYKICEKDVILKNHLDKIKETRIVSAFSDFEALVGAIISQNNSYRNYRRQMFSVYKKLNFIRENYTEKNLSGLKLGYKVPFLVGLAKDFGKIEISKIKGIGNYSVNLFEIFQKRNYATFYMDCLTEKILREKYKIKDNFEENTKKLWGKYRGLAEAYLQRFFEIK
jgi:3-methyladenine DNA glycosylase/8-oxoguanine DNA glycosylase